MAVEKKEKKRKAASTSIAASTNPPPLKKSKKIAEKPVKEKLDNAKSPASKELKSSNTTARSATKPKKTRVEGNSAVEEKPKARKRAVDFLSDDEEEQNVNDNKSKARKDGKSKSAKINQPKQPKKKVKVDDAEPVPEPVQKPTSKDKTTKKSPASKEGKSISRRKSATKDDEQVSAPEDGPEDDQTTALIQGFESSDDDASSDVGFTPGEELPDMPEPKKVKKKLRQLREKGEEQDEPGAVYVGRIPHGFYEHEMRAYFSQFGTITRLRLSRNRTTGRSKHYAFIEFSSASVAKVVASTMDNYLMFGHILKCKVIPQEKLHASLWNGANRRYQVVPYQMLDKKRLEAGKTRQQWTRSLEKENKKRTIQAEKMKALGYEYEIPKLKAVEDVPVRESQDHQIEGQSNTDTPKAVAAPVTEQKEEKKGNKEKKVETSKDDKETSQKTSKPTKEKKGKGKSAQPVTTPEKPKGSRKGEAKGKVGKSEKQKRKE